MNWKNIITSFSSKLKLNEFSKLFYNWQLAVNRDEVSSDIAGTVIRSMGLLIFLLFSIILFQCTHEGIQFDASGRFEAIEVIVSSEVTGKILKFDPKEGETVTRDSVAVEIDPLSLPFQKAYFESQISALSQKQMEADPQIKILKQQILVLESSISAQEVRMQFLLNEKKRTENLIEADAGIPKQLDEINVQIDELDKAIDASKQNVEVLNQQIKSHAETVSIQNRAITSEREPLEQQIALVADQISRSKVKNPVNGTILTKYVQAGEFATVGKALYKIADLSVLKLRAYITGEQLSTIKLGQQVIVYIDEGKESYREYPGKISWISNKAEFTPKTIQTKNERADLVYAIKIDVVSDGFLKIGMYGEVLFSDPENK